MSLEDNIRDMSLEQVKKAKNFLVDKALPVAEGKTFLDKEKDLTLVRKLNQHINLLDGEISNREFRNNGLEGMLKYVSDS